MTKCKPEINYGNNTSFRIKARRDRHREGLNQGLRKVISCPFRDRMRSREDSWRILASYLENPDFAIYQRE
jgi:hypothetical protein